MSFSQWIFSTIIFMQQYTHTVLRSANKFFLGSFDTICSLHGYMRVLLMSYFHVHTSVTDDLCYLITTWRYTAFAQRKACLSAFETRRSTSITAATPASRCNQCSCWAPRFWEPHAMEFGQVVHFSQILLTYENSIVENAYKLEMARSKIFQARTAHSLQHSTH